MLGHWRNIADLEESLNLPELQAILDAAREQRYEDRKFSAALKGINLDEGNNDSEERFNAVQRRVDEKLHGKKNVEQRDLDELAFDFEVEE